MNRRLLIVVLALGAAGCSARVVDHPVDATPEPTGGEGGSSGSTGGATDTTGGASSGSTAGDGDDPDGSISSSGGGATTGAFDTGGSGSGTDSGSTGGATTGGTSSSSSSTVTSASSTGTSGTSAGSTTGTTGLGAPQSSELVGTVLKATTGVNLRIAPTTSEPVVVVVASGSTVTVFGQSASVNGFFNVSYGGIHGWTYGSYYTVVSRPSSSAALTNRDKAIVRGEEAMGFSYWWGHGRFLDSGVSSSNAGTCSGSCPSCTHGGSYGGDCSGMVAKAWFLGSSALDTDSHPYSTYNFYNETTSWHGIDRGSAAMGDAFVYNSSGAGHIFLYETGDGWGSMWSFECKGCSYGCIHDLRTAGTAYKAIAHDGW